MSLDELFEILDCYVEQIDFSRTISTWEPSKVWYSTSKNTGVNQTPEITCTTSKNVDSAVYSIANSCTNGIAKFYDDGGSAQLTAQH